MDHYRLDFHVENLEQSGRAWVGINPVVAAL